VSFLSWHIFPPLTPKTLKTDLNLSTVDIANGNIVALLATLLVRVVIGPPYDRFGPRRCMIGCVILGAIPSALASTPTNAGGLIALRFFVGIPGGTFVPCQVWCTGFSTKIVLVAPMRWLLVGVMLEEESLISLCQRMYPPYFVLI
jgi:MFS transporter, NNP family, nitrate/nitrite transporter